MFLLRLFWRHITNNVVGYIALVIALSGSAYAVTAQDGPAPGQNSVGSLDIINGQVLTDDIGAGQVTRPKIAANAINGALVANGSLTQLDLYQAPWVNVAANPLTPDPLAEPCTHGGTAIFCGSATGAFGNIYWANYGDGFQAARFYRDTNYQVHLEGLVKYSPGLDTSGDPWYPIFLLPPGYRPAAGLIFPITCSLKGQPGHDGHGRLDIRPNGEVFYENVDDCAEGYYLSLSGVSFRASQ